WFSEKMHFPNASRKIARPGSSAPRLCPSSWIVRRERRKLRLLRRSGIKCFCPMRLQAARPRMVSSKCLRSRPPEGAPQPNREIPMRILQIMTSKANGGAETYACDVMTKLHEAGIDQCVVMHEDAARFAELKALGIRMAPSPLRVPFAPAQRFMLRGLIAREKPTTVQTWMRRAASLVTKASQPVNGWFGGYYDPRHFQSCERLVGVTRDIVVHMVKNGVPADRAHY